MGFVVFDRLLSSFLNKREFQKGKITRREHGRRSKLKSIKVEARCRTLHYIRLEYAARIFDFLTEIDFSLLRRPCSLLVILPF